MKNCQLTAEQAMMINSALYEAHGGYKPRTLVVKSELSLPIVESHLKVLERHGLVDRHANQWKFTGAGFTAYANIMCGNPN